MSGTAWDRIKEIFDRVVQEGASDRQRLLAELCGDDDALREEVEQLLEAHEDDGFLDSELLDAHGEIPWPGHRTPGTESPGDRIGPYKLLQAIGEGGFGVVYMAEQDEPIRRRVALKVIKPGMDTKQVVARFEAERQALAMMDHPNIAKVFDAGATPHGRPYFVMELVKGIPITDYCDEHRLDARARLALFRDVCSAVHHAHKSGIIHRDLKPSNVMVTLHDGRPVPKVIDFGVAKATGQRLTDATLFTEYHQFIGTPTYMSPEQAAYEGLDVDARSDVYSLGVLLYELLTGTTPHDSGAMKRAAYFEVLRILKEEEPPKPSTRVQTMGKGSTVHAERRGSDPNALQRLLRGDLDWIVMKALEKDRARRYDTPLDLAADIERYFESRPIDARPPSRLYRARKFARRRRTPLAGASIVAAALIVDVGYVSWRAGGIAEGGGSVEGLAVGDERIFAEERHYCFWYSKPSPDGRSLAYTDTCQGGLYVADLETGESRIVSDSAFYTGAAWSPDGSRIMAGWNFGNQARVFDVKNGAASIPARLADVRFAPEQWLSDGGRIVGETRDAEDNVTAVIASVSTGEVTPIVEGRRQGLPPLAVSPDGRYAAFGDDVDGQTDLHVTDLESGERWKVTETAVTESSVLWSPDGERLAFTDPTGLWTVPVRHGRPTETPTLVRRGEITPSGWTETGFYYMVRNTATRAFKIPVDPSDGRATGPWEPLELPVTDREMINFAWSPDMTRTAVVGGGDGVVYVTEAGRVTTYPVAPQLVPSRLWWSADGREILYTSSRRAQRDRTRGAVMALDPADGSVRPLYEPLEGVSNEDVSNDGRTMLTLQRGSRSWERLVLSDLGEVDGRVIASSGEGRVFSTRFGTPALSPTGTHALVIETNRGSVLMQLVPTDGSGQKIPLMEAEWLSRPLWDPTGRLAVIHTFARSTGSVLTVVDIETGARHELEGASALEDSALLDWSPDGRWIAIRETPGRWEVWRTPDLTLSDH